MSHNTGTVQPVTPAIEIGPDSGLPATAGTTWTHNFVHTPAPGGTKLLILQFGAASIPAGNRVEVDLGYGTDVFDSSAGSQFWTRPITGIGRFPWYWTVIFILFVIILILLLA